MIITPTLDPYTLDMRLLDAQVAHYLRGHTVDDDPDHGVRYWESGIVNSAVVPMCHYSTQINETWEMLADVFAADTILPPALVRRLDTVIMRNLAPWRMRPEAAAELICRTFLISYRMHLEGTP